MSNTGLPAPLASRAYRGIIQDAANNLGASRGPHLSTRGGRFRLIDGTGQEKLIDTHYVDLIVVDANVHSSRIYFGGPFDPLSDAPPMCFSDNGVGPSTQSMSPQSPTCQVCPHNVRGSDVTFTGKATTACSSRKKLAFILPDDPAVTVYELQIPPGSLTNFRNYCDWLRQQASGVANRPMDINDVVTRVSFDPGRQFVMQFEPAAYADDERTIQLVEYIYANKLADAAVGRNDVAHDPENVRRLLSAALTEGRVAAPAPAATPAPQQAQFQLPPRGNGGAAQPAPESGPKQRGRPRTVAPAPSAQLASPQAAPAAPQSAPPTLPPVQDDGGIPSFLQRAATPAPSQPTQGTAATLPTPPAQRFGVGPAPPPPAALNEALSKAMSLPTRK
jgi:hypothetical protein